MNDSATDPIQELDAMKAVAVALAPLDAEATGRVVRWAAERFGNVSLPRAGGHQDLRPLSSSIGTGTEVSAIAPPQFQHLADLYGAVSPSTDAERALVAGYWFQYIDGMPEFGAQTINSALKDMGHRVANITNAFAALKAQKPQLVVQLKKSGTSKQARKTYKLTAAGKSAVEAMISSED